MASSSTSSSTSPAKSILWSAEGETVDGETVDIHIGNWENRFEVNKAFLLDNVPFFRKLFKKFSPGVAGRKAIYPNGDPKSFNILLNWLHTHTLPVLTAKFGKGDGEVEYFGYQPDKLYYLLAKFELFNLANHIMDCLKPCHHYLYVGFSNEQIMSIYNQDIYGQETGEEVPFYGLRKFVSMWLLHEWISPGFEHKLSTEAEYESLLGEPAIFQDLGHLQAGLERKCPWHLLTCSLHKHDENNRCAQRMFTFETVESGQGDISVFTRLK